MGKFFVSVKKKFEMIMVKFEIQKEGLIIAGNKIYFFCKICQKLVQINKFLFGSLHICLSEKDIKKCAMRS